METQEGNIVDAVSQNFGSPGGQFVQSNINQFQSNPSQFGQNFGNQFGPNGQFVQTVGDRSAGTSL